MIDCSGIIVAGGRSSRFGERDKALVTVDGDPMIRRVADRLAPVVEELVVNCRHEQRDRLDEALAGCSLDLRFAVDPVPDRGPVYGLRTGLRTARGRHAVVMACDMPCLDPSLLEYLCDRAASTDADAVVPRVNGYPQPLCSVYDVTAGLSACEAAVARSNPSLRTVLSCLDTLTVEESTITDHASLGSLTNVNTPADLDSTPISK